MSKSTLSPEPVEESPAANGCPVCGGELVNVQGVLACAACGHSQI